MTITTALENISQFPRVCLGLAIATIFVAIVFNTRQRYPDVPLFRLSKKPGILGEWEDARLWQTDALTILLNGYEKFSSRGKHYMVSRPEGKLLIVAPAFVEEVRRAPESLVQNAPANNEVFSLCADFKYTD
jgi:hypothetical protein